MFHAVDRFGKPIKSGLETLRRVRDRIRQGPVVPLTIDRDHAELSHPRRSVAFGTRWIGSGELSIGDWAFDVCVPEPTRFEHASAVLRTELVRESQR